MHLVCDRLQRSGVEDFFLGRARPFLESIQSIEEALPKLRAVLPKVGQRVAGSFPDLPDPMLPATMWYTAYFAAFRPRLLQVWNADHLYPALAGVLAGVPRIILSAQSMTPRVRSPLGVESADEEFARKAFEFLLRFPSVSLTANSRAGREGYCEWLGIDRERILLMPNIFPVDSWPVPAQEEVESMRRELGIPPGARVLGGLFRMTAIKDPALWVNTAGCVLRRLPDVYAVLGGDGPLHAEFAAAAAGSPLGSRLLLPGVIRNAAAFHAMTDVHLLTSLVEGLPNVALEAQYTGKPVVAPLCGGIADIVEDDMTGFIVPERNPEALAARVGFILDNPAWAKEAGEKGRERVVRLFSKERSAEICKTLYAARPCAASEATV